MSDLPPKVTRFGPENPPDSVVAAKERADTLSVDIASIEGNISRLDTMMCDDAVSDEEYDTLKKQHVHALTAKRYCTVEQAWLKAWLRKHDPDSSEKMLRAILMQLVTLTAVISRRS